MQHHVICEGCGAVTDEKDIEVCENSVAQQTKLCPGCADIWWKDFFAAEERRMEEDVAGRKWR